MRPVPEVSVVTATYNDEPYLSQAVESILNQSFSNFEYIIIDDASSDGTRRALSNYAAQDTRVVVRRNNENLGRSISRNRALDLARGQWIAIFDGDDISHPERLERQLAYLKDNPRLDYVGTGCQYINKQTGESMLDRAFIPPVTHGQIRWRLCFDFPFHHSSTIGRKELFVGAGGYPEGYPVCEDIWLWMVMANEGACFGNIPEILLTYRVNTRPKYYALNQVIAQQLHRRHIASILEVSISESVFSAIWRTNREAIHRSNTQANAINSVEAVGILTALYRTLQANGVLAKGDEGSIKSDLLDRIVKVVRSTDSVADAGHRQSAYQNPYEVAPMSKPPYLRRSGE